MERKAKIAVLACVITAAIGAPLLYNSWLLKRAEKSDAEFVFVDEVRIALISYATTHEGKLPNLSNYSSLSQLAVDAGEAEWKVGESFEDAKVMLDNPPSKVIWTTPKSVESTTLDKLAPDAVIARAEFDNGHKWVIYASGGIKRLRKEN